MAALKPEICRDVVSERRIEIYKTVKGESDESSTEFKASSIGWLRKFMIRYSLSLRRRTTQSQQMPPDLIPKIQRFILHFRKLLTEKNLQKENIWAFDETAVWFDSVGATTGIKRKKRSRTFYYWS